MAIIFALNEELKPLLKKTKVEKRETIGETTFIKGRLLEIPITFCQTGIGMGNAHEGCESLLREFRPSLVLSVGYAGGLQKGINSGDLVLPNEIRSESNDSFRQDSGYFQKLSDAIEREKLPCHVGPVLTVFNPLKTPLEKEAAGRKGAIACDTETAAAAAVCEKKGIPFVSLRVIFDPLEMNLPVTTEGRLLKRAFFRIPQLFWRNRICQRNLAAVLTRLIRSL